MKKLLFAVIWSVVAVAFVFAGVRISQPIITDYASISNSLQSVTVSNLTATSTINATNLYVGYAFGGIFQGYFRGDGANLTNVNADTLDLFHADAFVLTNSALDLLMLGIGSGLTSSIPASAIVAPGSTGQLLINTNGTLGAAGNTTWDWANDRLVLGDTSGSTGSLGRLQITGTGVVQYVATKFGGNGATIYQRINGLQTNPTAVADSQIIGIFGQFQGSTNSTTILKSLATAYFAAYGPLSGTNWAGRYVFTCFPLSNTAAAVNALILGADNSTFASPLTASSNLTVNATTFLKGLVDSTIIVPSNSAVIAYNIYPQLPYSTPSNGENVAVSIYDTYDAGTNDAITVKGSKITFDVVSYIPPKTRQYVGGHLGPANFDSTTNGWNGFGTYGLMVGSFAAANTNTYPLTAGIRVGDISVVGTTTNIGYVIGVDVNPAFTNESAAWQTKSDVGVRIQASQKAALIITNNAAGANAIILQSTNGTLWKLQIDAAGAFFATSYP